MTTGEPTITITSSLYARLVADQKELNRLYAAGVDNWEGYDYEYEDAE